MKYLLRDPKATSTFDHATPVNGGAPRKMAPNSKMIIGMNWIVFLVLAAILSSGTGVKAASSTSYEYSHPCERPCEEGSQSMVCYYRFTVEWYYTLSKACYGCPINVTDCSRPHCIAANGIEKPIIVVNRKLPGPAIQVCENDTIIVDVENHAGSETTSIHWHGIHQVGTPHMDGVPMITQCPILPHNSFRYKFRASPAGTHFWHSHAGLQRSDGVHGMLVIRQPPALDPVYKFFDQDLPEHMAMVTDWLSDLSFDRFVAHHHDTGTNKPQSLLVNGKGRFQPFQDPTDNETVYTPVEVFRVRAGYRYRFRMASNGILNCPIQVSIDNHTLVVIASDGQPVEPLRVDSLVIYAGERFDFVLHAKQPVSSYWIRLQGLLDCDERFTKASQVAILRYEGAPQEDPPGEITYSHMNRGGKQLNPLNSGTTGNKLSIVELNSLLPDDRTSSKEADLKFYLPYDFTDINNKHYHDPHLYPIHAVQHNQKMYTPQINDISFVFPSAPLLSQPEETPSFLFCNHTAMQRNCSQEFCECTYKLDVPLGKTVELVIIDKGFTFEANHPIHIHGLSFRVMAMQRFGLNVTLQQVMKLEAEGKIKRKLNNAVVKDTVTVPDGGFIVIRFEANNPGYWILHCHIEFHIEVGMGLVFKVGEHKDMVRPPAHFPTCGNWPHESNEISSAGSDVTRSPTAILAAMVTVLLGWKIMSSQDTFRCIQ